MKRLFGLATIFGLVLAGTTDAADPKEKPIVVPFKLMSSGHFIVKVKLNDKGPYNLIFDTGAPTMLINNRIAKDSGVITTNTPQPLFAPFGSMGNMMIKDMQVGDAKAKDVSATVMDHPTVAVFSKAYEKETGPIDGIVGFPFFAKFKMTVDYKAQELTFIPNDYKPKDVMENMMATMMKSMEGKNEAKVLSPASQWGMVVGKDTDDEEGGVVIREVFKGTAVDKAGLKVNDRIMTIDGRWTDSIADCYQAAALVKSGRPVEVVIKRDGKEMKVTVTPQRGL
jgi:hypothetical protein